MDARDKPKNYRGDFAKAIFLHRELHRQIGQMALDEESNRQAIVHRLLCEALDRPDLLTPEPAELATAS